MNFTVNKVSTFTKIISFLKDTIDNITLSCQETGITTSSLNNTKTVMIETSMPDNAFSGYHCKEEKDIPIDLSSYLNVLKCVSKADTISHTITNDEKFNIEAKVGKRKTNVSLNILDIDTYKMEPTTDYDLVVEMDAKVLYQNIKDLCTFIGDKDITNKITINVLNGTIEFIAVSDLSDMKLTLEHPIETDETISFSVSGIHFLQMAKAYTFADKVSLFFANDRPLTMHYTCNDDQGWVRMFIAPMDD